MQADGLQGHQTEAANLSHPRASGKADLDHSKAGPEKVSVLDSETAPGTFTDSNRDVI